MTGEIRIRTANAKDMTSIASLSGELGYETTPDEIKTRLFNILNDPSHVVFVAVSIDDIVVGWIHVYTTFRLMTDPSAELGGFIVAESHRNLGIGKILLSRAEEWAVDNKCKLFVIRTRSTRSDAHRFYQQANYEFWKDHKVYRKDL